MVMIPPVIRNGPVPPPSKVNDRTEYVILTKRGWLIVKWHTGYGVLEDTDKSIPQDWRMIRPEDVLSWMPADGH